MLQDFHTNQSLRAHYDVCVVGGGPAGITTALQLAAKGLQVALLEGGGLAYSEASQSLYAVEQQGMNLYAEASRLRYLGGTSNHWTGRCRPFEAADFSRQPPTGLPGWPIAFDDFNRYLPAAMQILDLPSSGFQAGNADMPGNQFPADRHTQSTPTRFGEKYRAEMASTEQLHLLVNCNLVDIVYTNGAIRHLVVDDGSGMHTPLKASHYVLAMGAIENARLLLNSASLRASRLPAFDWVGRAFMEHLNVDLGSFIAAKGTEALDLQYFTSESLVNAKRIGRGNVSFGQLAEVVSYGRTAAVKTFMKNLACDMGVADKVQFITSFQCPGAGTIGTLLEQFPNAQGSRITLSETRDALGLFKARVHWTLAPEDRHTIKTVALEVARSFAAAGLGYVKLHPAITDDRLPLPVSPHAHHMGTTRMARSAQWGVVDTDCRMFGVRNLYLAGSSVFPTGGGGNPTMPLIQLALRLSEHLGQVARQGNTAREAAA